MRALLVGAGAVGQVYGRHLAEGGAEVAFLVKERHLPAGEGGFRLHRLGPGGASATLRAPAFTAQAALAAGPWDQVWLCVSATALRGGWLAPLLDGCGPRATIVLLTPGLDDRALVAGLVADERIVQGMISMISYQAPLPGERRDPGVAYWLPPLAPSPFSGAPARAQQVARALRAGGCPARVHRDAPLEAARGSAVLMPHLVALEAAGWSLAGLRRGPHLPLAGAAAREALAVVAASTGTRPARLHPWLTRPGLMRLVVGLAPCCVPLPLETYLRYHFTKVGDQTELMLATYVEQGRRAGLPVAHLSELLALLLRLREVRAVA